MKIELDKVEVEGLVGLLEHRYYSISRKFHRIIFPKCKKCNNEIITINKFNDALEKEGEDE